MVDFKSLEVGKLRSVLRLFSVPTKAQNGNSIKTAGTLHLSRQCILLLSCWVSWERHCVLGAKITKKCLSFRDIAAAVNEDLCLQETSAPVSGQRVPVQRHPIWMETSWLGPAKMPAVLGCKRVSSAHSLMLLIQRRCPALRWSRDSCLPDIGFKFWKGSGSTDFPVSYLSKS